MRGNPKSFKQYLRVIEHRVLRPRLWKAILERSTSSLSDEAFFKLSAWKGSKEDFIAQFHAAVKFRFFFHPRNQKDFFLQLLTQTQPYEEILAEAQDVLENRFETLGSGKVELGRDIHWRKDFKSGKEWPLKYLSSEEILDLGHSSDIKVPWELSRFHQVWWLGKAYWLTRNEEYAEKFGQLIENWIEQNSLGKGPNWAIAMEVAIRACNWIAGYYFFCESKSLTTEFWLKFLKTLYTHGRFIENHLEFSWRNGNHFLSNVVGLAYLGIFFHQAEFGKKWLRWGATHLQEEMEEQVYQDGVNYEKSTSYHRLVLELFYSAAILCQRNNIQLSKPFLERLEKMFEFVQHYSRPDGSIPLIGDADDGRLFRFSMGEDINDHRHALSVGAMLFQRSDFKIAAGRFAQDALWLFGGEGFEKHQLLRSDPIPPKSKAFPDGGFFILRSDRAHAFIDTGDLGMLGRGGHGHNDTFSFELWVNGEPLIVDSGTYAYTFDIKARQEFRSTRAHNTVMIDNKEIAEFNGLWSVKEDTTSPRVIDWKTTEQMDVLEAEHYGYQSLPVPVIHRRRFELNKPDLQLVITDVLIGSGLHHAESFLHFAPAITMELLNKQIAIASNRSGTYRIVATGGELSILETRFSRSYGIVEPNKTLRLNVQGQLPLTQRIDIRYE